MFSQFHRIKRKSYFFIIQIQEFLESDRRLDKPIYAKRNIYQIMLDCWQKEPKSRPRFNHLAEDLKKELESIAETNNEQYLDINLDQRLDDSKLIQL